MFVKIVDINGNQGGDCMVGIIFAILLIIAVISYALSGNKDDQALVLTAIVLVILFGFAACAVSFSYDNSTHYSHAREVKCAEFGCPRRVFNPDQNRYCPHHQYN